jgi:hypothetical protein
MTTTRVIKDNIEAEIKPVTNSTFTITVIQKTIIGVETFTGTIDQAVEQGRKLIKQHEK